MNCVLSLCDNDKKKKKHLHLKQTPPKACSQHYGYICSTWKKLDAQLVLSDGGSLLHHLFAGWLIKEETKPPSVADGGESVVQVVGATFFDVATLKNESGCKCIADALQSWWESTSLSLHSGGLRVNCALHHKPPSHCVVLFPPPPPWEHTISVEAQSWISGWGAIKKSQSFFIIILKAYSSLISIPQQFCLLTRVSTRRHGNSKDGSISVEAV